MSKAKKPKRMIGKMRFTFDYLRLDDDSDARPLFLLRDAPKGVVYPDEMSPDADIANGEKP